MGARGRAAALASLLFGAGAGAQLPPPAVTIESPSPSHEPAGDEPVRVRVAAADVREVAVVVNGVATRAPVLDGWAVAPMAWIAGNNRISVEARSRGRVVRDAVTVFRRPFEAPVFVVTVTRPDGTAAPDLDAALADAVEDGSFSGSPLARPGVFHVILMRSLWAGARPRSEGPADDDPGRPAHVAPRVRVEVRMGVGAVREQRWVFEARAPDTNAPRDVGTLTVTAAMLAAESPP